ncbi:uncharacterized protein DUF721 [Bisgaardia hudsonensis]|uniref:Uncharacterized protein DUF721 n=1 Tax=Bisgaardia hudsonensis TaxID=109472 RepID=A0A4R2N0D5_9PAST|nr:DciA family protein [Bisgaardia hudsonensis]QLB13415.1 hypothetical protein A6A11_07235 [Bisgaardia hudsonensis]TCP12820.1 uncharacterized protein DUF721 [Bisgaardia hudsonensis]
MRYSKPKNINQIIEKTTFSQIIKKSAFINELNEKIQFLFPKEFKGYYRVLEIEQHNILFEVANAMVRQAFLFNQKKLLELINKEYPEIKEIKFSINPELNSF